MRLKALSLALVGAALLPMGSAWALAPAATGAITNTNTIWVSGSTASDAALQSYFELDPAADPRGICATGTIDIYANSGAILTSGTVSGTYLISCTAATAVGLGAVNIAIVKQTSGGSARG